MCHPSYKVYTIYDIIKTALLFSFSQVEIGFAENDIVQLLNLHPLSNIEGPCFIAIYTVTQELTTVHKPQVYVATVDSGMEIIIVVSTGNVT